MTSFKGTCFALSLFSTEVTCTILSGVTPFLCLPDTSVYRLVECTPQVRQPLQLPEQYLDRFTEVLPILNISTHFDKCCDVSTT